MPSSAAVARPQDPSRLTGEYNRSLCMILETGLMAIVQCIYSQRASEKEEEAEDWNAKIVLWDG